MHPKCPSHSTREDDSLGMASCEDDEGMGMDQSLVGRLQRKGIRGHGNMATAAHKGEGCVCVCVCVCV